jgi:hydroxymethylpyrimidine/phosphomethylpyrimidine kinase
MQPIALTIAGSDSGGGAGIQADLKTFQAFQVFGTSVVTAVTAQNTVGVSAVHEVPLEMVEQQIADVAQDLRPSAVKSGMLATAEIAQVVAQSIRRFNLRNYVFDPVMVASSGDRLLTSDGEAALRELLPLATIVTPNLEEAAILVGKPVLTASHMHDAARALVEAGARAALVKGGHLPGDVLIDVLYDGRSFDTWEHPRLNPRNTHGTGCTLSAAIAAGLASGRSLRNAVTDGLDYVRRAIAQAPGLGKGEHGPLNHGVNPPRR